MKQRLPIREYMLGYVAKVDSHPGMKASHSHDELEMNLVLQGNSSYLLGSRRYVLEANTVVWLFPDQEHALLESSRDFKMWVVVFRPELVNRICETPFYRILKEKNPAGSFCKQIDLLYTQQIDFLLTGLASQSNNATLFNTGLSYALPLAWSIFSATTEVSFSHDVHPAVENAVTILKKNPFTHDLSAVASRAGLSPARLSRLFKDQIGVPMVHFRNRLRIARFLTLYGNGRRKNMMTTALEAGFGSYPQFHREFTRIMGCSPAEFRRRQIMSRAKACESAGSGENLWGIGR